MQGRKQHARGKWNHEQIIDEGPGIVVVDAAEGGLGQVQGCEDILQVRAHEHIVCCLDSNVRAGAYGDPQIGLRQGWRVVDPVAHHGHALLVRLLQCSHLQQHSRLFVLLIGLFTCPAAAMCDTVQGHSSHYGFDCCGVLLIFPVPRQ